MAKNPFGKEWSQSMLNALDAIDQHYEDYEHDRKYTVDGVLIETGLKVWCVDHYIGDAPWEIGHIPKKGPEYRISKDGDEPRTTRHRDASFRVMYADKTTAINQRIQKLNDKIDEVNQSEIFPRLKEIKELRERRDE